VADDGCFSAKREIKRIRGAGLGFDADAASPASGDPLQHFQLFAS
jgi:hypothetical protein